MGRKSLLVSLWHCGLEAVRMAYPGALPRKTARLAPDLPARKRYDAGRIDSPQRSMPKPKSKTKPRPPAPPQVIAAFRLQAAGRIAEAEAAYRAVLAAEPGQIEALDLLAQLCRARGDLAEALTLYAAVMKADRGSAEAASNHAVVLNELRRPAEALASLDRALILKPDAVPALYNRGNALFGLDRFEEAVRNYDRALAREPGHVDAWYNRGNALRELRRHDEALDSYRRALALAPHRADIHVNEALTLLRMGRLREGFSAYEWRRRGAAAALPGEPWTGVAPVAGKTIFLHAEQGFGDTLQFIRYAPLLVARGASVVAAVPAALKPLIAAMGNVAALTAGDPQPAFDLHCAVMSLPHAFGTEFATIPASIPYLRAPPDRVTHWGRRLPATTKRRVGLVWAGSAGFEGDRHRSLPFAKLMRAIVDKLGAAAASDVTFVGLQRDIPVADMPAVAAAADFTNIGPELRDFADTAAVISLLDLVIGVDTAVVHLAGALGKPVWIMLPHSPDFRWLLDRPDSPWYPTARLFRQSRRGDWDAVVAAVGAALVDERNSGVLAERPAQDAAAHLAAGRYDEALAACDRALARAPNAAAVHNDRGSALAELGRFEEAHAAFGRAIALSPNFSAAIFNQALVDLTLGNYPDGWGKYERRFDANRTPPPVGGPRWTGAEPLAGRTILVGAEQGFGDTLQFARYVPLLAERARVIFAVQPLLVPVMKTLAGAPAIISTRDATPPHDFASPLLSLPHVLDTTLETVPACVPYLAADPVRVAQWRDRLPAASALRVGLAWSGTKSFAWASQRSIALEHLEPLLRQRFAFVSLQRDIGAEDAAYVRSHTDIVHFGPALRDFADTAAIVSQLDLVISIDTAVTHLAGAMAQPLWVMLPFVPDFRWMRERADSPWYPTARLFRQPAPGDWTSVIARVADALARFVPGSAL
jgi:tetratricopeptide (TPR) repeat protein